MKKPRSSHARYLSIQHRKYRGPGDLVNKIQLLVEILEELDFNDLEKLMIQREKEIRDCFQLRNILSKEEILEIRSAMDNYQIPSPKGYAHGMSLGGLRNDMKTFSSEVFYDSNSLGNLWSTLRQIGINDKEIFSKIQKKLTLARKYGI